MYNSQAIRDLHFTSCEGHTHFPESAQAIIVFWPRVVHTGPCDAPVCTGQYKKTIFQDDSAKLEDSQLIIKRIQYCRCNRDCTVKRVNN